MILQHVGKRYYNEAIYFDTVIPLQWCCITQDITHNA
jgi:hypothetical protein